MPIRFRCAYCNQLMGIARRKAGTVVRCPTCSGQVVVPNPEAAAAAAPGPGPSAAGAAGAPPVFERSDFAELFGQTGEAEVPQPLQASAGAPPAPAAAPAAPPPAGAWGTHAEPPFGGGDRFEPMPDAGRPPGILLSPARATGLTVLIVVALAAAFGLGVVVGKLVLP